MKTLTGKATLSLVILFGTFTTGCERSIFSSFERLQASNDPNFECGCDMVDERDGRIYKTVQIGAQCWMAENLNYGEQIENSEYVEPPLEVVNTNLNDGVPNKLCPEDDPNKCELYGAFYSWEELMDYPDPDKITNSRSGQCPPSQTDSANERGLCPQGWKVPSDIEWEELQTFLDPGASSCGTFEYVGNSTKFKLLHPSLCENDPNCGQSGFNARFVGVITFSFSSPINNWQHFNAWVRYWTSTPTGYVDGAKCTDQCGGNCYGLLRELHIDSLGIGRNGHALYTKQDSASLCVLPKDRHTIALPCRCVKF